MFIARLCKHGFIDNLCTPTKLAFIKRFFPKLNHVIHAAHRRDIFRSRIGWSQWA
ncbi:Uncharacterised protein [Vibrio cholerae]|nr:Uncharacterised protein [Vibrio cholerae]